MPVAPGLNQKLLFSLLGWRLDLLISILILFYRSSAGITKSFKIGMAVPPMVAAT